ncbi:hypothetical protein [Cardiobacterium sp. Marseille-Q4385]|uniref:hypothetical protein n=1 Tax=Cardiobacterium sp. Marseille-Q4385 TaxID=2866573 RepID=UPI001CE4A9C1|nr:hypothetical protein [Cardiobacterium sp. Marseille-Q4385]
MSDILALLQPHLPADVLAQARATARPSIPYRLSVAADLPLTALRVGGIGYWPQAQHYLVPRRAAAALLALRTICLTPVGVKTSHLLSQKTQQNPFFPTIAADPYQEAPCPTSSPCYSRTFPPMFSRKPAPRRVLPSLTA